MSRGERDGPYRDALKNHIPLQSQIRFESCINDSAFARYDPMVPSPAVGSRDLDSINAFHLQVVTEREIPATAESAHRRRAGTTALGQTDS